MAGIRLEWAQFGDFDSFDIIRSTTSMVGVADVDLPTPIATGLKTMYYVDTTVTVGNTYYYKIRAWRDDVSVVSSEISCLSIPADPNWNYVTLLLNGDSLPITDSSPSPKTITNNGISLSTGKFNSAMQFGSNNGLVVPASVYSSIGYGDFCMTAWVYPTSYVGGGIDNDLFIFGSFSNSPTFIVFLTNNNGCLSLWDGTTQHTVPVSFACPLNTWTYIEVGRTSGTLRFFVGGKLAYTVNNSSKYYNNKANAYVGYNGGGNRLFRGRIDDLRFYKGWGGKTEDHDVPTLASGNFVW